METQSIFDNMPTFESIDEEMRYLYQYSNEWSLQRIANHFGVSKYYVHKHMLSHGIAHKPNNPNEPVPAHIRGSIRGLYKLRYPRTKDQKKAHAQGSRRFTQRALAKRFKLTQATINRIIHMSMPIDRKHAHIAKRIQEQKDKLKLKKARYIRKKYPNFNKPQSQPYQVIGKQIKKRLRYRVSRQEAAEIAQMILDGETYADVCSSNPITEGLYGIISRNARLLLPISKPVNPINKLKTRYRDIP